MKLPLIEKMSSQEYWDLKRELEAISYSVLKTFVDATPWRYRRGLRRKETEALKAGTLLDDLLLGSKGSLAKYAISPYARWQSDEAKAWKQAQLDAGKVPVKQAAYDELAQAAQGKDGALKPYVLELLEECDRGVAVFTTWPGTKHVVACHIDLVPGGKYSGWLFDLKSTSSPLPREYSYEVKKWRYHWQAAMYMDAFNHASKGRHPQVNNFGHLVIESSTPFENGLAKLPQQAIEDGRQDYTRAMADLIECMDTDRWPSPYDNGPVEVDWF